MISGNEPPATATENGSAEERSADEIRQDIERTREELGHTVDALAGRADLPARARARMDMVRSRVRGAGAEGSAGDMGALLRGNAGRAAGGAVAGVMVGVLMLWLWRKRR